MSKILAWIKEPNKKARHVHISKSLKNLQSIVGGNIEIYDLSPTQSIICNEDGLRLGLPYNCFCEGSDFVGTIIFVGTSGGDLTDSKLTKEQIEKICIGGN